MRPRGRRWDPRFSHFRRIENSLDHLYLQRSYPVLRSGSLYDRFRNFEASRKYLSLGLVAWAALGVFWYLGITLVVFYGCTGVFPAQHGLPFRQTPYAFTPGLVESYRQGSQWIDPEGTVLLDPDFDELLLIRIREDGSVDPAGLAEPGEQVARFCARKETHGTPQAVWILIHPDPGASYQDVVTMLERAAMTVETNPGCDLGFGLVTGMPVRTD